MPSHRKRSFRHLQKQRLKKRRCRIESLERRQLLAVTPGLPWTELVELNENPGFQSNSRSGRGVSISGDTIAVGSEGDTDLGLEAGAAYVYVRDDGGTPADPLDDSWQQQAKLFAGDTVAGDAFGHSVDLQGDTLVVGAYQSDKQGGGGPGVAYVFERSGTTWNEVAKLSASDGATADQFGTEIKMDGDTVVVTGFQNLGVGNGNGAAYVFSKPAGGWAGELTEDAKLVSSDFALGDRFGRGVDILGDSIMIGADQRDTGSGRVYVFQRDHNGTPQDASDDLWNESQILAADDGAMGDQFGETVVLDGSRALISAIKDDVNGITDAGSAYIFQRQPDGTWLQETKLIASDPGEKDEFGRGADIEGDRAVIGAWHGDISEPDSGSIYFFDRQADGIWVEQGEMTPNDDHLADTFGKQVALQGNTVVVGDPGHDHNGTNSGGVWVFVREPATVTDVLFSDSFEAGQWNGNWVEDSQNDWFTSSQRSTDGSYSAEVDGRATNATLTMANAVDLSGYNSAELTFDYYIESGFDSGEYLSMDVSSDGGSNWQSDVRRLSGNVDAENTWHSETVDLTPYASDNLLVRFRSKVSRSNEDANVDNVQISGTQSQAPEVYISDASAIEGNSVSFQLSLSSPSQSPVNVDFSTAEGSAIANSDYVSTSGTIVFDPGVTTRTIVVPTIDDTLAEASEYFSVNLSNPTGGATIVDGTGVGTIIDDGDPGSQPPVADDDTYAVAEDTVLNIAAPGVLDGDTDAESDPLTAAIVTQATSGVVVLDDDGSFDYTPNANFNGSDSFTYVANDGTSNSNVATVNLTVTAVNDAPVANSQIVAVKENTPKAIMLSGSDVEADPLSFTVQNGPISGTLSGTAPNLTYTPNVGFTGADSFTFVANDGTANSAAATITINVAENNAPIADPQSVGLDEDGSVAIGLTGSDADADPISFQIVGTPLHGNLTGTAPNLSYTPDADYHGDDSFTFLVNDGTDDSAVATVALTVNPTNDAPTANAQSVGTAEDVSLAITLSGSDLDGDPLSYIIVDSPSSGVLSGSGANRTYTPNANFNGDDSFAFKVNDGQVDSGVVTVSIDVSAVNDAPVATADSYSLDQDTTLSVVAPGVLDNDSDIDGDSLTASLVTTTGNGSLTLLGDGSFDYTPNPGFVGSDSFSYQAHDGTIGGNTVTVSLMVDAVSAGPNLSHGVVNVASSWQTVTLGTSYTSMVVVATPNYDSNSTPAVVRIQNASGNSFQIRVDAAGPTAVGNMDVHYIVMEEGVYDEPGYKLEAVKYTSTVTDENNSWAGESRSYGQSYSSPVVLGQVMTYNDSDWSTFWSRGASRTAVPSSSALYVGKHVGEDADTTRADETIGYIVIETNSSGTAEIEGLPYVAAVGGDTIKGVGDSPSYSYGYNAMPNSKTAVASMAAMDGGNGGWAVLYGSDPITSNGNTLNLAIEEDQSKDSERKHTSEQVAYFIIDPPLANELRANESSPVSMVNRLDVNRDGRTSAIDALMVINWLSGDRQAVASERFDTNQDGRVSVLDSLFLINRLSTFANTNAAVADHSPTEIDRDAIDGFFAGDDESEEQLDDDIHRFAIKLT